MAWVYRLAVVLCCGVIVLAATDRFTVRIAAPIVTGREQRLTFHVPTRPENRLLAYAWDGEFDSGSSQIELVEGDHVTTQITFERWLKHLSAGHYVVTAVLYATDGEQRRVLNFEVMP